MKIRLRKTLFSRNRHREKEKTSLFDTIYKNLSFLTNVAFVIILAPTIVISSLLSHASFLMIANIFLALGFVVHFCHRIYLREVSYSELLISLVAIGLLCLLAFYLSPAITSWTFISTLCFINLFSTSITSFFLIRNLIIPPLQSTIQHVSKSLGYEETTAFFYIKPLSVAKDRGVVNILLNKFYNYGSFSKKYSDDDLKPFNKIIDVLSHYVNKYQQPVLGYINNYERIKELENAISKLVNNGDTVSSLGFVNKKIMFKNSKIEALSEVRVLLDKHKQENKIELNNINRFFYSLHPITEENQTQTLDTCIALLETEIIRQQAKVNDLSSCVPRLTRT